MTEKSSFFNTLRHKLHLSLRRTVVLEGELSALQDRIQTIGFALQLGEHTLDPVKIHVQLAKKRRREGEEIYMELKKRQKSRFPSRRPRINLVDYEKVFGQ